MIVMHTSENKKAYISELFSGIQGEGLWVGLRQIFLRFSGCDLRCQWCDTPNSLNIKQNSFAKIEKTAGKRDFEEFKNPLSFDFLLESIYSLEKDFKHHSISLTGGEPLLQANFIKDFIIDLKKNSSLLIYLETGGHRFEELEQLINNLDIISFDLKLPSSTGEKPLWEEHCKFVELIKKYNKKAYAKMVLTSQTSKHDLEQSFDLMKNLIENCTLVLQPVTSSDLSLIPSPEQILNWQAMGINQLKSPNIRVIPQTHKFIGQI